MKSVDPTKAYRLFYPTVPAVLAASHRSRFAAMPVVSYTSVSSSPPRVGIAVSPTHQTHGVILASRAFSLSWLDMKYAKAVEFLGIRSSAEFKDKLAASGLTHELGSVLKVPIIRKAVAVLECDLVGVHKTGDHDFLIGEIKAARASSDFSDYWRFKDYNPILYIGSENGFEVQTMK